MKFIITILILAIVLIAGCTSDSVPISSSKPEKIPKITITRIIDGDTYELSNGEKIRVLGIDYPDITENRIDKWIDIGINEARLIDCYHEGIEKLEDWILNKEVNLTKDPNEQDKDKYDRLLRYVTIGNTDVGDDLISSGYAIMYDPTEPECDRCGSYQSLTDETRTKSLGCLWKNYYELSDLPAPFVENEIMKTIFIAGENSSIEHIKVAVGVAVEMAMTGGVESFTDYGPLIWLDSEITISNLSERPMVLIGGPNDNEISALALGVEYPTSNDILGITKNGGIVKLINSAFVEEYPILIVAGDNDNSTCLAGDVLANYKNYNFTGTEFLVGESYSDTIKNESICDEELELTTI